jgi:hypothetical protein
LDYFLFEQAAHRSGDDRWIILAIRFVLQEHYLQANLSARSRAISGLPQILRMLIPVGEKARARDNSVERCREKTPLLHPERRNDSERLAKYLKQLSNDPPYRADPFPKTLAGFEACLSHCQRTLGMRPFLVSGRHLEHAL